MFAVIGYSALALYACLLVLKYALSRYYLSRHQDLAEETTSVDVTVLQPVLSGDPLLQETLSKSIATAPDGAVFWLLVDEDDAEGLRVAGELHHGYPTTVRLVTCQPPQQGENPKATKLDAVLPEITSTFVAVLDDDTWLPHGNLAKGAARLGTCDLYTGLPCYVPSGGLWSSLVAHFVNNNTVMTYLAFLPVTGPLTINGMFYMIRTETIRQLGGWNRYSDILCDDLAIANQFRHAGLRIHQGVTTQFLNTTVASPGHYFALMHRWYVFAENLLLSQPLAKKLLIVCLLGFPPLLLWGGLLSLVGGGWGAVCLLATFLLRHLVIGDLLRRVAETPPPVSWWRSLLAEFIQPVHLCHARVSRTIYWRTRKIHARRDGRFTYLDERAET